MKIGDRVRDRFKKPVGPGDLTCEGNVIHVDSSSVIIMMDDGMRRALPVHSAGSIFEVVK